ncbi:MAG: MFS transporter [Planctomycetota bacterium]|jgi:predicted MFS family arabinose efflux permease
MTLQGNSDFRRFWLGESITFFGGAVREVALPLTAVIWLRATPAQMGVLVTLQMLPTLFLSLLGGVWIDRVRRRPIIVAGNVVRAALLLIVPVFALADTLTMAHLYVVACGLGAVSVISMIAGRAYLPSLLPPEQLLPANSRLEFSHSTALLAGPGIGGALVGWLTAPVTLAIDAVALLLGASILASIRHEEPAPVAPDEPRKSIRSEIREGLRVVLHHPVLRPIVLCGASHNFASQMIVAIQILYMNRVLGLGPFTIGIIMGATGPGALVGAALAPRIANRIGMGPTLILSQVLTGIARFLIPLAMGPTAAVIAILLVSKILLGIARPLFNVNQISLRQRAVPGHLQGRINATFSFLLWGLPPLGAAFGGWLAMQIGMRTTLFIGAAGVLAATLWALPIRYRESSAGTGG